ncbi:hypothetical protein XPA_001090 [Xanthoria parietina]
MSLARSLQNSGSDIVIEEDLANIFGRCRIAPHREREFREVVGKNHSSTLSSALGLTLEDGPGPTVLRGLTQPPYLAMVIQSSLLTFIHEKSSLAAAIVQIFEREVDEADSSQHRRAVPSQEGIFGVLRACEDQTSAYNWKGLLLAVASILDIFEADALEPVPSIVLQGAVHMFPLVQSLPDDRIVLIDTHEGAGACCLLVWAHHVLGLTVLVRKDDHVEKQFGSGSNHVVLDLRDKSLTWIGNQSTLEIRQPSITLLSVSDNEPLLVLRSEPDEVALDATYKQPAGGYGRKTLEHECGTEAGREALIHELILLALAFAAILAQHLYTKPRSAFNDNKSKVPKGTTTEGIPSGGQPSLHEPSNEGFRCQVPEDGLIRSARFLFNEPDLSFDLVERHLLAFSRQPLNGEMKMPRSISLMLDENPPKYMEKKETAWQDMLRKVRYLSIVLLTFAFVRDLENSTDLPLSPLLGPLGQGDLMHSWNRWDGRSNIWIPEDCWFLVLARLLVGHKGAFDSESTCLVSDRGWSIFLSTFGDADPWFTDAGHVVVRKGIPCRGGVRKHSVTDGPGAGFGDNWQVVHAAGQGESLRCLDAVYPSRPLCGDRHGSFLVNVRFSLQKPARKGVRRTGWKEDVGNETETRRTGYRELFAALWGVQRTEGCQHESSELRLPLSCVSVSRFGDLEMSKLKEKARVYICLTARNSCARWRALLAVHMNSHVFPQFDVIKQVMLRGEDCCFQCAVKQTLVRAGHWFLVL